MWNADWSGGLGANHPAQVPARRERPSEETDQDGCTQWHHRVGVVMVVSMVMVALFSRYVFQASSLRQ